MRPGLPLVGVYAALPVLLTQGRRVRRTTARLPDATGPSGLCGEGSEPHSLVVVGDSVAAGVGVDRHEHTVAGRLAAHLAGRGRPVTWTVVARTGATAAGVCVLVEELDDDDVLARADVVVVSTGVNDVTGLRSDRQWRRDLAGLLDLVLARAPHADVVLLGLPPMQRFPAMPRALGAVMGARARRLDAIGRSVVATRPRVSRLDLDAALRSLDHTAFADDGFHPSAAVHEEIAARITALV